MTQVSGQAVTRLAFDATCFIGMGYLACYSVNQLAKLAKPSLFLTGHYVNPIGATACCGLFVLIDRVVQTFFQGDKKTHSDLEETCRSSLLKMSCLYTSVAILNLAKPVAKALHSTKCKELAAELALEFPKALLVVSIALALYTTWLVCVEKFDKRFR